MEAACASETFEISPTATRCNNPRTVLTWMSHEFMSRMGIEPTIPKVRGQCSAGLHDTALVNGDTYKILPVNSRPQVDFSFITNLSEQFYPDALPLWTHSGICFECVFRTVHGNCSRKGISRGTVVEPFNQPTGLGRTLSESHDKTILLVVTQYWHYCWYGHFLFRCIGCH